MDLNEIIIDAINKKNIDLVKEYVQKGADVNYIYKVVDIISLEKENMSIIFQACKNNNKDIIKYLLENGASETINYKCVRYEETPFLVASYKGTPDILQLLIEYGADPFIEDKYGSNALMYSNLSNTKFLLDIGFKILLIIKINVGRPLYISLFMMKIQCMKEQKFC